MPQTLSLPGLHFLYYIMFLQPMLINGSKSHSQVPKAEVTLRTSIMVFGFIRKHGLEGFSRYWAQRGSLIALPPVSVSPWNSLSPQVENVEEKLGISLACTGKVNLEVRYVKTRMEDESSGWSGWRMSAVAFPQMLQCVLRIQIKPTHAALNAGALIFQEHISFLYF